MDGSWTERRAQILSWRISKALEVASGLCRFQFFEIVGPNVIPDNIIKRKNERINFWRSTGRMIFDCILTKKTAPCQHAPILSRC